MMVTWVRTEQWRWRGKFRRAGRQKYIFGQRPQKDATKANELAPRKAQSLSTGEGPGEKRWRSKTEAFLSPSQVRRWRRLGKPQCGEARVADDKYPPEDSPELHVPPELSEVLKAHAVRFLEAAEQCLAVCLQAWRGPHDCRARIRRKRSSSRRSPRRPGPEAPPPTM